MEPAEAKIRYVIKNIFVQKVEEHKHKRWISGVGDKAVFEETSNGWFIYLAGSYEALWAGFDKPTLRRGDLVTITMEKQ